MMSEILLALWFFLPAGIANTTPVFAAKIPLLKSFTYPIDNYTYFRGKRIFGDHKTIRGLLTGILMGILVVYFQQYLFSNYDLIQRSISLNYNNVSPILLGGLLGFGSLFGDMIESFFKRQIGIAPGKSWFPFDQTDYIIGGILASFFYMQLSLLLYFLIFFVWFFMHIIFSYIGYLLHLKDTPI